MRVTSNGKGVLGTFVASVLLSLPMAGWSADAAKGPNEVAGRLSYANVDLGPAETTDTEFNLAYGRYLTENHEVGLTATYVKNEIEEEDFGSESVDGMGVGAFYHFNFTTSGMITPFLGASVGFIGGDIGDLYDYQYGIEGGIKVYPFENAGVSVGLAWQQLVAAEDEWDDADGLAFAIGLLIRF